ncbi:GNAT family N-acetyltransferase [Nakamurella sp. A5-74]|uniref:GNAT family N-acetyltransferase n=1 Tax=Nakamurella sp. A5-74 TaxID=3158264 RepID=A0AAU8DV10_9ACTN
MSAPPEFEVRLARDDELDRVVQLRWQWALEVGEPTGDEEAFVRLAGQWAREHRSTHLPHIAVTPGGSLLGMAWLALTARVASASNIDRCSGDLQSCFILPELRGIGIGGALVRAVLATAHARGAEHVTVHASPDSVNLYARNGFRASGQFLWADTTERDH